MFIYSFIVILSGFWQKGSKKNVKFKISEK